MQTRYVLIALFASATGYSVKAVEKKIETGVWVEGIHYKRAPDNRIVIDIKGYESWVEGQRLAA